MVINRERIEIGNVVTEVVRSLKPSAAEKNLELETELPYEPLTVLSDRKMISQIIINLASNAVKYTDAGSIIVRARGHERKGIRSVEISVIDTGPGISVSQQEKLFLPFGRLANCGNQQGTGLGLYLAQKIARNLGGRIELASICGQGSEFKFTFPAGG